MITLDEFVQLVANEFEETPVEMFNKDTHYRELEEWGSLLALSVISAVDDELDVIITGADLRSCTTIEDLYNFILSK
jgi:acyl carrier protein